MLFVDKQEDLAGLPEWVCQSAAAEAKAAGQEGKWLFTLHNASRIPFLQYSDNRPLREKIYKAYSTAVITMTRTTTRKSLPTSSVCVLKKPAC